jgi:hypothetical protein
MPDNLDQSEARASPIRRPDGTTNAERYLKTLGDRTFLSLWGHAEIYRDEGRGGRGGHGKEVCDLLVVFDNHIIIFSDKDCKYPETDDSLLNWSRWYRRAIENSARQVRGAEKWIREYPNLLFLDRACTQPFPIKLPDPEKAVFHRILVAHGAAPCCRRDLGGSGSLMIVPTIVGRMHYDPEAEFPPFNPFGVRPFAIGRVDSTKGYIHVLDDTSLSIVMQTRDTITDFVDYLSKKEALIESGRLLFASGEEDLLAYYLKETNEAGEHDFILPSGQCVLSVQEGTWEHFNQSPGRKGQIEADRISYVWDREIEKSAGHFFGGTYHHGSHLTYADVERLLRFFARESRVRRRFLAQALVELVEKGVEAERTTRVIKPTAPGDNYYIFLTLKSRPNQSQEEYRQFRQRFLEGFCRVAKLTYPDAQGFVCYATEPGLTNPLRSEDAAYIDFADWTAEDEAEARELQQKTGFFTNVSVSHREIKEYLVPVSPNKLFRARLTREPKSFRNSPCPCGSGKKRKRCCG